MHFKSISYLLASIAMLQWFTSNFNRLKLLHKKVKGEKKIYTNNEHGNILTHNSKKNNIYKYNTNISVRKKKSQEYMPNLHAMFLKSWIRWYDQPKFSSCSLVNIVPVGSVWYNINQINSTKLVNLAEKSSPTRCYISPLPAFSLTFISFLLLSIHV